MSYRKAADVLPRELVDRIQDYIDGEYIYIPRKAAARKAWGEKTNSRTALAVRNLEIYEKYAAGMSVARLSETYYLSPKSLQKIIARMKTANR